MGTELAIFEPIKPPTADRPGTIPCWPEWVVSLLAGCERTMSGKLEIRASRALTQMQRNLILSYVLSLDALCERTPQTDKAADQAMLVILSKMLNVLAGSKKQESENEHKAEAYAMAIEDISAWAIESAVRGWYRGAYGPKHDYAWPPAPAVLRGLALFEAGKIQGRAIELRKLLEAEIRPDYTDEYRGTMLGRLVDVMRGITGKTQAAE